MASLTNRYTDALFAATKGEGSTDAVAEDLQVLAIALGERDLTTLLDNPEVARDKKVELLTNVMAAGGRNVHERTQKFLDVVLEHGRQALLAEIAAGFRVRALETRGQVEGLVETALELDDEDRGKLEAALGKLVRSKVLLTARLDPSLLGGFRVRIGDRMFDASLKGQLEALGHKLKGISLAELR